MNVVCSSWTYNSRQLQSIENREGEKGGCEVVGRDVKGKGGRDGEQARRQEIKWRVVKKWTLPPQNETKLNQTLLCKLRF